MNGVWKEEGYRAKENLLLQAAHNGLAGEAAVLLASGAREYTAPECIRSAILEAIARDGEDMEDTDACRCVDSEDILMVLLCWQIKHGAKTQPQFWRQARENYENSEFAEHYILRLFDMLEGKCEDELNPLVSRLLEQINTENAQTAAVLMEMVWARSCASGEAWGLEHLRRLEERNFTVDDGLESDEQQMERARSMSADPCWLECCGILEGEEVCRLSARIYRSRDIDEVARLSAAASAIQGKRMLFPYRVCRQILEGRF